MRRLNLSSGNMFVVVAMLFVTAVAVRAVGTSAARVEGVQAANPPPPQAVKAIRGSTVTQEAQDPVLRGRELVLHHACGECHGGNDDPSAPGWLAGLMPGPNAVEFEIGPPPCGIQPKAKGCFKTRPRNLTPDNDTGMGRFTERQLFNALRFGLRPENTPDVTI